MAVDLGRLLHPRSIAVIGGDWAANVVEQCQRMDFQGDIWPVNPKRESVHSLPCYDAVASLPGPVDAAFVGVNREQTVEVVAALSESGAGGAVCFASGFAESENPGGVTQQAELLKAASYMPLIGPNCYGLINYLDGALLWPDEHGGVRVDRGVAILTQSSNIAINMTHQRRGLPIAYVMTGGNQAQIGLAEMAAALMDDPRVTAIGLYIEGIGDIRAFEAMATKAHALKKPVIALKVGRSEQARAASLSHTASLAGHEAGANALLERLGIAQVHTVTAFLESLKLLHVHGPMLGNNACSLSCSGGEAGLMADLAHGSNLDFRPLSDAEKQRLKATLGAAVTIANPLDYHTYIWGDYDKLKATFAGMMAGGFDLSMLVLDMPREDRCDTSAWTPTIKAWEDAAAELQAPTAIVSLLPENMPETLADDLIKKNIAPMCGMQAALVAAEAAVTIGKGLSHALLPPVFLSSALRSDDTEIELLSEYKAKNELAAFGLQIPHMAVADSVDDLSTAAEHVDYPLVLKGLGVAHKSEAHAVVLNISDADTLIKEANRMMPDVNGFLLEQMITGGVVELIIGALRDEAHGFVITIGEGGVFTEVLNDAVSMLWPVSVDDIRQALERLRIAPILTGYRGRSAADIEAIVQAVQAIGAFIEAYADRFEELDVNPLIVLPQGAIVLDALIRLRKTD